MSYIIVIYEHFYHNNPFLSVSYLHCFLFVCFYFRPLNKNSKVRCLKLFFIYFFHESKVVDMHFYSSLGWERGEMKDSEGGARFLPGRCPGSAFGGSACPADPEVEQLPQGHLTASCLGALVPSLSPSHLGGAALGLPCPGHSPHSLHTAVPTPSCGQILSSILCCR